MKHALYGLEFDYEGGGGASTSLTVQINPKVGHQIITYQHRMMRDNRIPRLLPHIIEEVNGALFLRYDISSKRKLTQLLRMQPPNMKLIMETAYLLVQTLCDCTAYLLNENNLALQEDLIFTSGNLPEFQLCYLPIEGLQKRPVTEELRCLLIRLLSAVEGEYGLGLAPVLAVLSEEQYSLKTLKQQLKRIWLSGDEQSHSQTITAAPSEKLVVRKSWNLGAWFPSSNKKISSSHSMKKPIEVQPKFTGKTEYLSARPSVEENQIVLHILRDGKEESLHMNEERWMIGRSESGTQYTDLSEGVSRVHCEISKHDNENNLEVEVKDLGSLNGSYLNGDRMIPYKSYPFTSSDVLRYASTELRMTVARQSSQLV